MQNELFEYYDSDTGITITKYIGSIADKIVIPSEIEGKPVTTIGNSIWYTDYDFIKFKRIKSIIIPNTVTTIEEGTFTDCRSLKSVVIPESVTEIGNHAFGECTVLKHWQVSPDNPCFKSEGRCLISKDGKTLVCCPSASGKFVIPDSITTIGEEAFCFCTLKAVVIPNRVTEIRSFAFVGCHSLKSVILPNSITAIEWGTFSYCDSLKSIDIPNSVTDIEQHAFRCCCSLKSIDIPESVTIIRGETFAYCQSLKYMILPASIQTIEEKAFESCTALTSIVIPNRVTKIENDSFAGCPRLTIHALNDSVAHQYATENKIPFHGYSSEEELATFATVLKRKRKIEELKWYWLWILIGVVLLLSDLTD